MGVGFGSVFAEPVVGIGSSFEGAGFDAIGTIADAVATADHTAAYNTALANWTSDEAVVQTQYDADLDAAATAWESAEATAWTIFDSIETPARALREAAISTSEAVYQGIVTAATTIWEATESAAWTFAESQIAVAAATWTSDESLARNDLEADVDAATQTADSTIQGLQTQADQAWTDYLATLAPDDTPTVTQQPSLDMSLAMIPGLSSVVMASLVGGPPVTTAPAIPGSTQIWVAARDLTGLFIGTHRFVVVSWSQYDAMPQGILDLLGQANGLQTITPRALGNGRVGFTIGGHNINGVLTPVFNQYADLQAYREGTDPRTLNVFTRREVELGSLTLMA